MKVPISLVLCLLVFIGCKEDGKLFFELEEISEEACEGCPNIYIGIPRSLEDSKLSETINTALDEELIYQLVFDEDIEVATISEAIQSFQNGYDELRNLYPDEITPWEANITGSVSYENKDILTIALNSYLFTGGAHGYTTQRLLNFDKRKGGEMDNWELFKDKDRFKQFAETKFRIQEGIPQESPINTTGFMFEDDKFHLPENIGFNEKGLVLLYNQYEVASYADGAITLVLPFNEVKNYLAKHIVR